MDCYGFAFRLDIAWDILNKKKRKNFVWTNPYLLNIATNPKTADPITAITIRTTHGGISSTAEVKVVVAL